MAKARWHYIETTHFKQSFKKLPLHRPEAFLAELEAWATTFDNSHPTAQSSRTVVNEQFEVWVNKWPNKERSKHLVRLRTMLDWYEPRALVLENFAGKSSRKGKRTSSVIISMVRIATRQGVRVEGFSRERIRDAFEGAGARTKHEIATAIAQKFPELSPRIPRPSRPWMNEHLSTGRATASRSLPTPCRRSVG